ncbi:MAG: hypothetical protein AAF564_24070 [Bacteroidota bacterium]
MRYLALIFLLLGCTASQPTNNTYASSEGCDNPNCDPELTLKITHGFVDPVTNSYTLAGYVYGYINGETQGLANARVLFNAVEAMATDADGYFHVQGEDAKQSIKISHVGFKIHSAPAAQIVHNFLLESSR